MTNLEHFLENGLTLMEEGVASEEWKRRMSEDPNKPYVSVNVDDLWEMCQYIFYSYLPCAVDDEIERREKAFIDEWCKLPNN